MRGRKIFDLYDSNTMKHQCHLYWQEDLELKDKPLVLVFFAPSRLRVSLFLDHAKTLRRKDE